MNHRPNQYPTMTALARTFPSMLHADGIDPFDAERLEEWARGPAATSGSRAAALFLLSVFNPFAMRDRACGPFDLHDALGCWDQGHLDAFLAWARAPWWP